MYIIVSCTIFHTDIPLALFTKAKNVPGIFFLLQYLMAALLALASTPEPSAATNK